MEISRRDAIRAGIAAAAVASVSGCRQGVRAVMGDDLPESLQPPPGPAEPTVRLLNRAGFGPRPGEIEAAAQLGRAAWIERQLRADADEPVALTLQLHRLDVLRLEASDLKDLPMDEVVRQLQQAQILRAAYSPNQLRERMVDFWSDHFNIYARKADGAFRKGVDDAAVIRRHALGNFPAMLAASAKSPAMLGYLDNAANRKGVPNENYARELMELHSLGVDGGYTQKDIQEVARCLSGWTVEDRFLHPRDKVRFEPDWHDDGPKTVLGARIPVGGGEKDAEIVVALLAEHPSTAKYLARKLCLYFLGSRSERIEAEVADAYMASNGDIRAMLRPMLLSSELVESPPILKRPFDYVVSALRAVDADTPARATIQAHLRRMGQPGYEWPMPDGYPTETGAWTGSLLARWNFALAFLNDLLGDVRDRIDPLREKFQGTDLDFLAYLFFGVRASHAALAPILPTLRQALTRENGLREAALLCISSPQFQWR